MMRCAALPGPASGGVMFSLRYRDSSAVAPRGNTNMCEDEFVRVGMASDLGALEFEVQKFTSSLGFERYGVVVLHDDFSGPSSCKRAGAIENVPHEYAEIYNNSALVKCDPVLQHCKRSSFPGVFGQDAYVDAGAGERWERQALFGYGYGIATAFHLPGNRHVLFGIDRRDKLPSAPSELVELVSRVQLFGTFVQCAALSLLYIEPPEARSRIRLSRREHECLRWAAEGKTAWETGMILSIAEGSVAKVLAAAIRKLECATKPQAVVKALRLGLIH